MKIYLATWIGDPVHGECLTKVGGVRRLLSYYFILEQRISRKKFVKYCKTIKHED